MRVNWKRGSRISACSAEDAHQFLEDVRQKSGGVIDIDLAIKLSKPKNAPLHNALTWDKDEALTKIQRHEMRYAIRSIEVVRDDIETPMRAYESITVECQPEATDEEDAEHHERVYMSVDDALADPNYRQQLLEQAAKDATAFRKRYGALTELATLISVMDEVIPQISK